MYALRHIRRKYKDIEVIPKVKFNSIESIILKSIQKSSINEKIYICINNKVKRYCKLKEEIKEKINSMNSFCYACWNLKEKELLNMVVKNFFKNWVMHK